jgi:SAM-dependent methyltransferase
MIEDGEYVMELIYENICDYFEKLNSDNSHFTNSNDICTPIGCVKEMVDSIPNEFWRRKNIKILDSCCGNGNFPAYLVTKTDLSNIYFNDINIKRIDNIKKYFGCNVNLSEQDFLKFDEKNKFDLIVSNPPYALFSNGKRASKNHNLSRAFLEKAINLVNDNGYILFILPNNWMSYADRNKLPHKLSDMQFIHLNINGAKKWFPKVGSSFTWFLVKKAPNKSSFIVENNYILNDIQNVKIDKNIDFIPLYYSEIVRNIINKTINNRNIPKYKIETSSFLHKYTKREHISTKKDGINKYKLIHTPSQTVWSDIPHKYQDNYKVFISLTNQYSTFIDNCGMTQSIAFVRCGSFEEAKKIKKELDNDLYKFLNNITRYGNFNNIRTLQQFPELEYIDLTDEEKEFIADFNRRYYGKKEK